MIFSLSKVVMLHQCHCAYPFYWRKLNIPTKPCNEYLEICSFVLSPPNALDPERNGWNLVDNKYYPRWFNGEMNPPNIHYIDSDDIAADDVIYPSDSDNRTYTEE